MAKTEHIKLCMNVLCREYNAFSIVNYNIGWEIS